MFASSRQKALHAPTFGRRRTSSLRATTRTALLDRSDVSSGSKKLIGMSKAVPPRARRRRSPDHAGSAAPTAIMEVRYDLGDEPDPRRRHFRFG